MHVAFKAIRETKYVEIPDEDWVREAEQPLSRYEQEMLDDICTYGNRRCRCLRGKIRHAQEKHVQRARRVPRRPALKTTLAEQE